MHDPTLNILSCVRSGRMKKLGTFRDMLGNSLNEGMAHRRYSRKRKTKGGWRQKCHHRNFYAKIFLEGHHMQLCRKEEEENATAEATNIQGKELLARILTNFNAANQVECPGKLLPHMYSSFSLV